MAENILPRELQDRYLSIISDSRTLRDRRDRARNHPADRCVGGIIYRLPVLVWMAWLTHNVAILLAGGNNTPVLWYLVGFLAAVAFSKILWEGFVAPRIVTHRLSRTIPDNTAIAAELRIWWKDVAELIAAAGHGDLVAPKFDDATNLSQRVFGHGDTLWSVTPLVHHGNVWLIDHTGQPLGSAVTRKPTGKSRRQKGRA